MRIRVYVFKARGLEIQADVTQDPQSATTGTVHTSILPVSQYRFGSWIRIATEI